MNFFHRIPKRGRIPVGRTVLVTGGASGLGLALATRFARRGDDVIVTDIHDTAPDAVTDLADSVDSTVTYRRLDVTRESDWDSAVADIGDLDVIVLNAGRAVGGRIEEVSTETWRQTIDLNLMGIVLGCRAFVPHIRDEGQVVITASIMGLIYPAFMTTYNATKAAAVAIAETLHFELSPRRITVTAICPQFFRTPLIHSLSKDDEPVNELARILMGKTWLRLDPVADRAFRAIMARRLISTPDAAAAVSWRAKRYAPPLYRAGTAALVGALRARMHRRHPETRPAPNPFPG